MSIFIVIVGIIVLILVHELGHFLAARVFKVKVEEFGFGFPPRLFAKQRGETTYSFNLLPLGGFVRLLGERPDKPVEIAEESRSFSHQKIWRRAIITVAGVVTNFILGWLIISTLFFIGSDGPVGITSVLPNSPAEMMELRPGDLITDFNRTDEFITFINSHRGEQILLAITRGTEKIVVAVTPRLVVAEGEGALGIGIAQTGFPKSGFWSSLWLGLTTTLSIIWIIVVSLVGLVASVFTGGVVWQNFVGPVGLFQIASQAGQFGLIYVLQLVGLISLNLAVLNFVPFPALDGGRLLFLLIEKIKGTPITPKLEGIVNVVGFAFLLLLMVAITLKDIIYLF